MDNRKSHHWGKLQFAYAERTVKHMLKQFEWITVDQKFFGEPGSAYDFKATDPKDAAKRVQKLEDNKVCAKVL